jgi:hypothetical protein
VKRSGLDASAATIFPQGRSADPLERSAFEHRAISSSSVSAVTVIT